MNEPLAHFAAHIPAQEAVVRPTTDAQLHPDNVRRHNLEAIKRSLLSHGQRTPIVVQRSTGFIVKGNGTWEAAVQLGWTELLQSWQDLDDAQAHAYLLADNRASDLAAWDRERLSAELQRLFEGPGLTDTLFTIDDLEDMLAESRPGLEPAAAERGYNEPEDQRLARETAGETPGEKYREVPLLYSLADHAEFVERVAQLRQQYGTRGVMGTVLEAVRRQAAAEGEATPLVGMGLSDRAKAQERYEALREFRDLIVTLGTGREYRGTWLVAQLEAAIAALGIPRAEIVPPVLPAADVAAADVELEALES